MQAKANKSRGTVGIAILLSALWFAPVQAQDSSASELQPSGLPQQIGDANLLRDNEAIDQLKPGEFVWLPAAKVDNSAPVMVVVSISDQRAYVYRGGERIAISTVSTGKRGHETPTGVFPILQKEKMHHSSLYDDAPMPFMQRLTWDGVALHAGRIPGHPASHGCVRLPLEFARSLFDVTRSGQTVVVSDDGSVDALVRAGLSQPLSVMVAAASSIRDIVNNVARPVAQQASSGGSDMDIAYERGNSSTFASQQ
jgi:hypothetical protein